MTLDGKLRPLSVGPTRYKVLDIASDGRVLLNLDLDEKAIEALMADSPNPVNIEFGASSSSAWVANDGKSLLISDQSTPSVRHIPAQRRRCTGSPWNGCTHRVVAGRPLGAGAAGIGLSAVPASNGSWTIADTERSGKYRV